MKRLITLISGRGSNLQALVAQSEKEAWPMEHCCVISNRPDAQGLAIAKEAGLKTQVIDHTTFPSRAAFDQALQKAITEFDPDVIALAGFMRVLTDEFCMQFEGKLINVHPSLLPSFAGLDTHRRALACGVKVHGCTVHAVTPQLDHGPILSQAIVPVLSGDDEQTLSARVLEMEHVAFPSAVAAVLSGRKRFSNGVWADGPAAFAHSFSECLVHPLLTAA